MRPSAVFSLLSLLLGALLAVSTAQFTPDILSGNNNPTVPLGATFQVVIGIDSGLPTLNTPPAIQSATYTPTVTNPNNVQFTAQPSQFTLSASNPQVVYTITVSGNNVGLVSIAFVSSDAAVGADLATPVQFTASQRSVIVGEIAADCADAACVAPNMFFGVTSQPVRVSLDSPLPVGAASITLTPRVADETANLGTAQCTFSPNVITFSAGQTAQYLVFSCPWQNNVLEAGLTDLRLYFSIGENGGQDWFPSEVSSSPVTPISFNRQPLAVRGTPSVFAGHSTTFAVYSPTGPLSTDVTLTYFAWGFGFTTPQTVTLRQGTDSVLITLTSNTAQVDDFNLAHTLTFYLSNAASDLFSLATPSIDIDVQRLPALLATTDSVTLKPGSAVRVSVHTVVATPVDVGVSVDGAGLEFSTDGTTFSANIELLFSPTTLTQAFWVRVNSDKWQPQNTNSEISLRLFGSDVMLYAPNDRSWTIDVSVPALRIEVDAQTVYDVPLGSTYTVTVTLNEAPPFTSITIYLANANGLIGTSTPASLTFDQTSSLRQSFTVSAPLTTLNWDAFRLFIASPGDDDKFYTSTIVTSNVVQSDSALRTVDFLPPASSATDFFVAGIESDPFVVTLDVPPANGLTVDVWSPYVSVSPSRLTFDATTTSQSFSVTPLAGALSSGESFSVDIYYAVSGTDAWQYTPVFDDDVLTSIDVIARTVNLLDVTGGGGSVLTSGSLSATVNNWETVEFTLDYPVDSELEVTPLWVDGFVEFDPPGPWTIPAGARNFRVQWRPLSVFSGVRLQLRLDGDDAALYAWTNNNNVIDVSSSLSTISVAVGGGGFANSLSPSQWQQVFVDLGVPTENGVSILFSGSDLEFSPSAQLAFASGQRYGSVSIRVGSRIALDPNGAGGDSSDGLGNRPQYTLSFSIEGADAAWYTSNPSSRFLRLTSSSLASATGISVRFATATANTLGTAVQYGTVVLPYPTDNGITLLIHSPCIDTPTGTVSVSLTPGSRTASFSFDVASFAPLNEASCLFSYELTGADAGFYDVPNDRTVPGDLAGGASRRIYIGTDELDDFSFGDGSNVGAGFSFGSGSSVINGYLHTVGQTSPAYLVTLGAPPQQQLTLTLHSPFATFEPPTLVFTPTNWAQTFTLTPNRTTPATSPYGYVTYSLSGADASSYADTVASVVSRISVRPRLVFGLLRSLTAGVSASSWVSVDGDQSQWDAFNLVLACGSSLPSSTVDTRTASQAPYVFAPASLGFDPQQGLNNNTFTYRVNPRRNQLSYAGASQGTCKTVYYVLPRNIIDGTPFNPAQYFASSYSSDAPELTVLSQGQVIIDFPRSLRQGREQTYRVWLSPAPAYGEVRIRPTSPNVYFNPAVLVFREGENMVEGRARLTAIAYSQGVISGDAPFEITWSLDEGSDRYDAPGNTFHRDGSAGSAVVSFALLALVAIMTWVL